MWPSQESISSCKTILSVAASLTASALLLRTVADEVIPDAIRDCFRTSLRNFSTRLSSQITFILHEFNGLAANQIFEAANIFLGTKPFPSTARLVVNKSEKERQLTVTVDKNQELTDIYMGVKFKWLLVSKEKSVSDSKRDRNALPNLEVRYFKLSFPKKYKDMAMNSYFPYLLREAKSITESKKSVKLHMVDYNGTDYWSSINLDHPATFSTMAMDPEMKKALIEDLDNFMKRKEYYKKVGKAWKRGYLLFGPPGTGKSSLVAAMANYLNFDIYDLDLREVQCNSDLRRLLIGTGSKSILVIEDIDCSFELKNRDSENETYKSVEDEKITLSGLLNFIDGLWSSCGDERIVVLTTNHKERVDPALLRPGRMDVQLHMSYCTSSGFKTLSKNYLSIQEHPLFGEIEELLGEVQVTPAEVSGELMKGDNAQLSLQGLVHFLRSRKNEA